MASSAKERESVGSVEFVAFAVFVKNTGTIWRTNDHGSRSNTCRNEYVCLSDRFLTRLLSDTNAVPRRD